MSVRTLPVMLAAVIGFSSIALEAIAAETVGLVVGLRGFATATAPGREPRRLQCLDVIHDDEVVNTSEGSRVSVLIGDVYAQMFVFSEARFALTSDGGAQLFLDQGRMRVIDPRTAGDVPDIEMTTPRARASFRANDIDAYVLAPMGDSNAMICSERVDLHVHRTDAAGGSLGVSLGECVVASKDNGTYNAKIPSERIGLREADDCEVELGSVPARFAGIDVASPPLPEGIDLPTTIDILPRRPCDDPGAGCGPAFAEPAFTDTVNSPFDGSDLIDQLFNLND